MFLDADRLAKEAGRVTVEIVSPDCDLVAR